MEKDNTEVAVREQFQIDLRKQITSKRVVVGGLAIAGLAIVLPVAIMAIQAGMAIVAAGALAMGGFLAWKRIPLWVQKNENSIKEANQIELNRHLASIKSEARANPIEQLQNYLIQKREQLTSFKSAVGQIGAQVKSLGDMLSERKSKKPDGDYSKKDAALHAMSDAYESLKKKSEAGEAAIRQLGEVIEEKKFDWKFAQAGQNAMQHMRAMSGQEILDEMLAGEAFDSIRENFNRVFSDIELEIGNLNNQSQLSFEEGMSIDVSAIHIPEVQSVRRN